MASMSERVTGMAATCSWRCPPARPDSAAYRERATGILCHASAEARRPPFLRSLGWCGPAQSTYLSCTNLPQSRDLCVAAGTTAATLYRYCRWLYCTVVAANLLQCFIGLETFDGLYPPADPAESSRLRALLLASMGNGVMWQVRLGAGLFGCT